jgi:hypothetical protein
MNNKNQNKSVFTNTYLLFLKFCFSNIYLYTIFNNNKKIMIKFTIKYIYIIFEKGNLYNIYIYFKENNFKYI